MFGMEVMIWQRGVCRGRYFKGWGYPGFGGGGVSDCFVDRDRQKGVP